MSNKNTLNPIIMTVFILLILTGVFWLDYSAYRQRFPNAAAWTYFFSR